MPFMVRWRIRSMNEEVKVEIDAIIHNECNSVHSAVYWNLKGRSRHIYDSIGMEINSFF